MSYGKWHRTPSSRTVCAILDRSSRMSRVIGALYRLLYDGVLCRLPEPTAVALGHLPPRVPLIVSVAGDSVGAYVTLVKALGRAADLVEFNISSPNTRLVYEWSRKPRELVALPRAVRAATDKPLVVKLSPDFADANEAEIIPAALEAGIRIVNYGNTRRVEDRRLSQGSGGLSGPDLFPSTLENLRRTRARFGRELEIIATGGVDSPDKAHRLLREGATAVGYFTGFITRGPILAREILELLRADR